MHKQKNAYFAIGSVRLGGIEQMDSTKSLWAAVVQWRAREDQGAAQPHLLAVKWKIMNLILTPWQADLNTNQRQSQQQRQGISISVLFSWGSRSAHLDIAGPSVNKQKEQSKRSLHGLLVNGFIYYNFWCFARGRYKGSMFWGTTSMKDHAAKKGASSLLIILPPSRCLPLSLSPRRAAGPDWID